MIDQHVVGRCGVQKDEAASAAGEIHCCPADCGGDHWCDSRGISKGLCCVDAAIGFDVVGPQLSRDMSGHHGSELSGDPA